MSGGLDDLWDRLGRVRSLEFVARSETGTGWIGTGRGTVEVSRVAAGVLTFAESGTWQPQRGRPLSFSNVFRWSRHDEAGVVRLEHLRFGPGRPVYLFDLEPVTDGEWRSVSPHLCEADCYAARLTIAEEVSHLAWSVNGPGKREAIAYVYR